MSAAPPPVAAPKAPAPAAPPAAPKTDRLPPGTPPVVPEERPVKEWMQDSSEELDRLSGEETERTEGRARPKPAKAPERGVEPPPDDTGKEGKEVTPKPGETAAPEPELKGIAAVRSALDTLKKKVKDEYEPKLQQHAALEAKVKELEGKAPADVKALEERVTATEARNKLLEEEIVFVNYSKSKEYQDKYEAPYRQAWNDAISELAELTVEEADGTTRTATQHDMEMLANMPAGEARKKANAMFGDSADDVIAHRRKIIDLARSQEKALEEAKGKGLERVKQTEQQRKESRAREQQLWTEANSALTERYPKMFGPVEGDAEGNSMLEKGLAQADRIFAPTPETAPKTPEERVALHALARYKIANHNRQARWLKNAKARIKELETKLKDYEGSEPNGGLTGGPGGTGTGGYLEDANAELDQLAKQSR